MTREELAWKMQVVEAQFLNACYQGVPHRVSKDGNHCFSALNEKTGQEVLMQIEGTDMTAFWENGARS